MMMKKQNKTNYTDYTKSLVKWVWGDGIGACARLRLCGFRFRDDLSTSAESGSGRRERLFARLID